MTKTKSKTKRTKKALTAPPVAYLSPNEPRDVKRDRPLVSLHESGYWSAEFRGALGYGADPGAALAAIGWIL